MAESKYYPLRLPPGYHGTPKANRRLSEINKERSSHRDNPEYLQTKIGHWQLKRLDRDVELERRQFVTNPAKISLDSPDWFKTTLHFHTNNYLSNSRREPARSYYDVLNTTKPEPRTQVMEDSFTSTRMPNLSTTWRRQVPVSPKIVARDPALTGTRWSPVKSQVTGKVGSVLQRDFSIRKPVLKIGQSNGDNFVNTYSVF